MTTEEIRILTAALIVIGVIAVLSALVLLISYITYREIFMRRRKEYDPYYGLDAPKYKVHSEFLGRIIESMGAEPYEMLAITARDGIKLFARYYHRKDGAPLHLICHGYKSSPLRDGSGGGCDSRSMEHNLLLIYQRAHGESEGRTITFGILERYDILDWANYMTDKLGDKTEIILIGTSMGAASVLMASELDLPDTVKCIIADCPYSSPREIIQKSAADMGYPARLIYPFVRLGARLFGHFSPDAASTTEAVKRARVPLLICHGKDDSMVPYQMSEKIAGSALAAGMECTLALFDNAEHCISFVVDYDGYVAIRDEFLSKHVRGFDPKWRYNE